MSSAKKKLLIKRYLMMLIGIFFVGICVGLYRLGEFGADAFTCMNLGMCEFFPVSFGTCQLLTNAAIMIAVFFNARHCIGAGTIVNMATVGYLADFICWMVKDLLQIHMTLPLRLAALILGSLFAGLGIALYMAADAGIAAYDSAAIIIEDMTHGRIPFQFARVISDITIIIIGVIFCLLAGGNVWLILGFGTIYTALVHGPLIQFFKTHAADPIMGSSRTTR